MQDKIQLLRQIKESGKVLAQKARENRKLHTAVKVARTAAPAFPVKEVASMCGRAGVAGAVVDGGMGGMNALKSLRSGKINTAQAVKHVTAEAGCGFVTSASGTAGTLAVYMVWGVMGPAALAAGMGASMGSRYLYRKVVGETLPGEEKREERDDHDDGTDLMEEIGPKPQT